MYFYMPLHTRDLLLSSNNYTEWNIVDASFPLWLLSDITGIMTAFLASSSCDWKKLGVAKIKESMSMLPQRFFSGKGKRTLQVWIKVHYRTGANEEQAPCRWKIFSAHTISISWDCGLWIIGQHRLSFFTAY